MLITSEIIFMGQKIVIKSFQLNGFENFYCSFDFEWNKICWEGFMEFEGYEAHLIIEDPCANIFKI